jgi:cell shape-determining protein MreC
MRFGASDKIDVIDIATDLQELRALVKALQAQIRKQDVEMKKLENENQHLRYLLREAGNHENH